MNWRKACAVLAVLALGFFAATSAVSSRSNGISKAEGLTEEGCVCHGANRQSDGRVNPNVGVFFNVSGHPFKWETGKVYNISLGSDASDVPEATTPGANRGGFNLRVNVGVLAAATGEEKFVTIIGPTEATHTAEGDQRPGRTFNLTWTAPTDGEEAAVFTLFFNTVNGDGANDDKDHYNGLTYVILGSSGRLGGATEADPEAIGVRWLAHWVGIVSFLAVIGTLLVYYFVLKYGESIHTTDHRDRKEK